MFGDFKEKTDVSSRPVWQEVPSIGKESERPSDSREQPWKRDGEAFTIEPSYESERPSESMEQPWKRDGEAFTIEPSYESERPSESMEQPWKENIDDNGNIYRINDELLPNNTYEINGYKYITDVLGRIISAEGFLHLKNHEGRLTIKDEMSVIGKGDEKETDDRGHLIADQFDGSNKMENLLPQDAQFNRVEFKNFENQLAAEVKQGKDVYYKIEPVYEGDLRRPDGYVVTYSIDGEKNVRVFENGKENF